jgi:hypothetical protein
MNLVASGDSIEIPFDHVTAMMYVLPQGAKEPSINECTIDGNTIIYDVLPTDIVTEGITEMQVKIVEGRLDGARKVLVSPKFALEVTESNIDDEGAEQTTTFTALEDAVAKAEAVYNSRLVSVEITDEYNFRAYYADGTYYETDALYEALYNGNALLSESYAVGGTGIREGEDTDNSMYYANVSRSASAGVSSIADESRALLDEARLQTSYTAFNVNFETGNLDYASANYTFDVNEETGNLEAENDGSYVPEQVIGGVITDYLEEKTAELDQMLEDVNNELSEQIAIVEEKADTATSIAKGRNQAHVFSTTEEMQAWLSDSANKGLWMEGDNIYIVELNVPDWWVAEVLEEADAETGYFYKIAQLETQKVDLTNYVVTGSTAELTSVKLGGSDIALVYNDNDDVAFRHKNSAGETVWTKLKDLWASINNKLPLAGGTMTGNINTCSLVPAKSSTYHVGNSSTPFASMRSNAYIALGSDLVQYAKFYAGALGTASTVGLSDIQLGNATASGTAGNAKGRVILYNSGSKYAVIQDNDSATANRTFTLPKTAGILVSGSVSGTTLNLYM